MPFVEVKVVCHVGILLCLFAQGGDQEGYDIVEVPDDLVLRYLEYGRVRIGVDRDDFIGLRHSGAVLDGSRNA